METSPEQISSAINPDILKAFHLMWNAFPSSVLLLTESNHCGLQSSGDRERSSGWHEMFPTLKRRSSQLL